MTEVEKAVKHLLYKHDYITVVQKDEDGCIITYPQPILMDDRPRLIEAFAFQRGNEPGMYSLTSYDKDGNGRFISLPEYAFRLYIICEITACNLAIPIDPSLMVFVDDEGVECESVLDVVNSPSTKDGVNKEGFLYRLIIEARNDGFPPKFEEVASTHGVSEGYHTIRKFYES